MKKQLKFLLFAGSFVFFVHSCTKDITEPPKKVIKEDTTSTDTSSTDTTSTDTTVTEACDTLFKTYADDINPIISTNCATSISCHGSGSGNGDFTSYSGVKAKIGVNNDPFNQRVMVDKDMPPSGSLTAEELEKLQCWLDEGAPE